MLPLRPLHVSQAINCAMHTGPGFRRRFGLQLSLARSIRFVSYPTGDHNHAG
jgi:hypothetical protein